MGRRTINALKQTRKSLLVARRSRENVNLRPKMSHKQILRKRKFNLKRIRKK